MFDSGIAIGTGIKIRRLEEIIYKLKKGIDLDEREQKMVEEIIKTKE